MASGSVGARRRSGSLGDLVLGSWPRTVTAAGLIALLVVLGLWAFASGWLGGLRYESFPGHPYPPTGYYQNPFNPKDRGDLINATQASSVKADLLGDGDLELQAIGSGDPALLGPADAGNRLARLQQIISDNTKAGVTARQVTKFDSIVVGRQSDPNSPGITWCVEEKGRATITYLAKASGQTLREESFAFDDRYWLSDRGGHFLIVDAEIINRPGPGA